jgi:D-arabinose 1-dehydrogenase-like Zn-dependent alcohol dehydrogenase
MRAARIHQHGGRKVLVCEDAPEPRLRPDQVLVRVCAGIPARMFQCRMVEHVGVATWPKSLESLAPAGLLGSLMGSMGESHQALKLVFRKQLKRVVGRVYPLAGIRAAHERLENREHFGMAIVRP